MPLPSLKTVKPRCYIGIDNGVSGSIGIIHPEGCEYIATPIISEQNYTKTKKNISRVDSKKLISLLTYYSQKYRCHVLLERPMVNPGRFHATISAIRALEATLIILETLNIPFEYIDSKEWQKNVLPRMTQEESKKTDLKKLSLDIGKRLYPSINWKGFKDADGILIAHYLKKRESQNFQ